MENDLSSENRSTPQTEANLCKHALTILEMKKYLGTKSSLIAKIYG